jgi:hypothetical protein
VIASNGSAISVMVDPRLLTDSPNQNRAKSRLRRSRLDRFHRPQAADRSVRTSTHYATSASPFAPERRRRAPAPIAGADCRSQPNDLAGLVHLRQYRTPNRLPRRRFTQGAISAEFTLDRLV